MGWMGWYAISANDRLKRGCFAVAVQFLNHRNASGVMPVRVSPAQHATEWLRGFHSEAGARRNARLLPNARCGAGVRHGRTPAIVRGKFGHSQGYVGGLFAKVLLVDHAILADDERHQSRVAVFRGVGKNGETALCFSFGGDPVVIAVEERMIAGVGSHDFTEVAELSGVCGLT